MQGCRMGLLPFSSGEPLEIMPVQLMTVQRYTLQAKMHANTHLLRQFKVTNKPSTDIFVQWVDAGVLGKNLRMQEEYIQTPCRNGEGWVSYLGPACCKEAASALPYSQRVKLRKHKQLSHFLGVISLATLGLNSRLNCRIKKSNPTTWRGLRNLKRQYSNAMKTD